MSKSLKISWKYEKQKVKNANFNEVIKKLNSTIDFHAFQTSQKTSLEKDDIKQKILLKIFKTLDKYDPKKTKINTYFGWVIKNHCIDIIRSEYREKRKDYCIEQEEIKTIDKGFDQVELRNELKKYADLLDERSKKIFDKLSIGMRIKDIANDMQLSMNIVYSVINRKIKPVLENN